MNRHALYLLAAALLPTSALARPPACGTLDGALVVASDGTYLGKIVDQYDTNSIFNKFGTFGSKYSAKSIWNEFGVYGSEYSDKSAMSEYTNSPPAIVIKGKVVGHLTKNKFKAGAINPEVLGIACYNYEPG